MPDYSPEGSSTNPSPLTPSCPACGLECGDWLPHCPRCGHALRDASSAARTERSHVVYLLAQIGWWRSRRLLGGSLADRLENDYRQRQKALEAELSHLVAPQPAPPIVPPLPELPTMPQREARPDRVTPPPPVPFPVPAATAASPAVALTSLSSAAAPGVPLPPARPWEKVLLAFLQTHALKLLFALATLLVVFALRSMIAWEAVGAIAVRLIPLVPMALTAMFWLFGERTRQENAWAAFVYHSMAAVSLGFDAAAINRYWLEPAGLGLALKPALLLAVLASTLTAGSMLLRHRRLPYLHLFEFGLLLTLYAGLQQTRLLLWQQSDFRAVPLSLFGAAYLLLAGLNFTLAQRLRHSTARGEDIKPGEHDAMTADPGQWSAGLALWAHLSAVAVVFSACLSVLLEQQVSLQEFALLALLGSLLYGAAAQMLEERQMVFVSGGLALAASGLWLADSYTLLWNHYGFLLMAISAVSLALAAYNMGRSPQNEQPAEKKSPLQMSLSEDAAGAQAAHQEANGTERPVVWPSSGASLAQAWRQVGRIGVAMAAALVGYQILARWIGASLHALPVEAAFTGVAQAVLSGFFLLVLARQERRSEPVYAALTAWGLALVSLLEGIRVPMGGYALTMMAYGGALWALSRLLESRQQAAQGAVPVDSKDASAIPMPSLKRAPAQKDSLTFVVPCAAVGQAAATLGALLAALLPLQGLSAAWGWSALTLLLGGAMYADITQQKQSAAAVYSSLGCLAYSSVLVCWRLLPHGSYTALPAPFMLGTALAALWISGRMFSPKTSTNRTDATVSPSVSENSVTSWLQWSDPLAVMSLFAVLFACYSTLALLLTGMPQKYPAAALAPAVAACLLLAAARKEETTDLLRSLAVALGNIALALEIALLCGMQVGLTEWTLPMLHHVCVGWLIQGWLLWLAGGALSRWYKTETWTADLRGNGVATAFVAAFILTPITLIYFHDAHGLPVSIVLSGAFLLMIADSYQTRSSASRGLALALNVAGAIMCLNVYQSHTGYFATGWTLFSLLAAGCFFLLAHREQEPALAYNALLPLTLGYGLFAFWRAQGSLPVLDQHLAEGLWLLGGLGAGWGYLRATKQSGRQSFAVLSALLLLADYRHAVGLVHSVTAPWEALSLLPMLAALALYGLFRETQEECIAAPFRQVAMILSGIALLYSLAAGDGLLSWQNPSDAVMPALGTVTLAAYGLAYSALACYRRTPFTVGVGASTLTAAYLHGLLTLTDLWHRTPALVSWSQVAFLTLTAGFAWLMIGGLLKGRLNRADLGLPLFTLSAALGLGSALPALLLPPADDWSLLTLACAGALWIGLWRLDCGEVTWHLGAWNLLASWYLLIHLHLQYNSGAVDLYLLPVGLYLLIAGHRVSARQKAGEARMLWWLGLLTILLPAFLAFWNRVPGLHAILLLIECVAAVGWGIARHIRSYVSAGLIFAVALTTSVILGHLPDYAATLLALLIGVGLFIAGFYALSHQDRLKQWGLLLNARWHIWQSWR